MNDETKQVLQLALEILRKTCVDQGVSIAVNKENGLILYKVEQPM